MNTGEKIKMLRKSAKMTQAELAEKLGVRDAAVAKYETGRVTNLKLYNTEMAMLEFQQF